MSSITETIECPLCFMDFSTDVVSNHAAQCVCASHEQCSTMFHCHTRTDRHVLWHNDKTARPTYKYIYHASCLASMASCPGQKTRLRVHLKGRPGAMRNAQALKYVERTVPSYVRGYRVIGGCYSSNLRTLCGCTCTLLGIEGLWFVGPSFVTLVDYDPAIRTAIVVHCRPGLKSPWS